MWTESEKRRGTMKQPVVERGNSLHWQRMWSAVDERRSTRSAGIDGRRSRALMGRWNTPIGHSTCGPSRAQMLTAVKDRESTIGVSCGADGSAAEYAVAESLNTTPPGSESWANVVYLRDPALHQMLGRQLARPLWCDPQVDILQG